MPNSPVPVPASTLRTKKLNLYIMYEGQHPFLVGRRTEKNAKGKHVTREEFMKLGCLWPTRVAQDRTALANLIGETILDEVFGFTIPMGNVPSGQKMIGTKPAPAIKGRLCRAFKIDPDEDDEPQEMPWEHDAREALDRFLAGYRIAEEGSFEVKQHSTVLRDRALKFKDESDPHELPFTCTDLPGLRSVLHEIGGNAWSAQVPVESGEQVFDWHSVAEGYIDRALERHPDVVEFFEE